MIVWDRGRYRNMTEREGEGVPMAAGLEAGHVAVWLEGKKLSGGYALTRIGRRRTAKGKKERRLLVKMDDEEADARRNPVSTEPASVVSGRTIKDVARSSSGG